MGISVLSTEAKAQTPSVLWLLVFNPRLPRSCRLLGMKPEKGKEHGGKHLGNTSGPGHITSAHFPPGHRYLQTGNVI